MNSAASVGSSIPMGRANRILACLDVCLFVCL